ncbi:MAG TPA: AAA family ATPase [Amaricoccus sp.]|uniref:AAA family ATPase n=1 Tax=Amaricoccus sp. TaxID=1872485 RepID=UPI002CACDE0C|nr:AAA family ATPase [Amaricoccus sp.]HMR51207.1 AAA family ATPase [Amaricoccus sp.]HMT98044.1 AAA family ATPase [Amaricoccus sp.]
MPVKPCAEPGCGTLVDVGTARCPRHAEAEAVRRWREADAARSHRPERKWYFTARWKRRRSMQLRVEPLCVHCLKLGRTTPATVADHVVPHRGNAALFWFGELQSLCDHHHNSAKQREERGAGATRGSGGADLPAKRTGGPVAEMGPLAYPRWFRGVHVPLTIVCGPPGAGKSTWVERHARKADLVICFDRIVAELYGVKRLDRASGHSLGDVLRRRNEMLGHLMRRDAARRWPRAWLIVGEPRAERRQWWRDRLGPREIIVLPVAAAECKRRCAADAAAGDARVEEIDRVIDDWWRDYRPRSGDVVVS